MTDKSTVTASLLMLGTVALGTLVWLALKISQPPKASKPGV